MIGMPSSAAHQLIRGLAGSWMNKKCKIHGVEKSGVSKSGIYQIPTPFTRFLCISMAEEYYRCISPQTKEIESRISTATMAQLSG
jgi:hypothetical protein